MSDENERSGASDGSVWHASTRAIFIASLALNAVSLWAWMQNASHPTVPQAVIRHGVGVAYCSPASANTLADFALIDSIVCEVERESNEWLRRWWR